MPINDLETKYIRILQILKKQGIKNKFLFLLLLVIASVYAYYYLLPLHSEYPENDEISKKALIWLVIGLAIFWIVILMVSKSITFISSKRVRYFKADFKASLFECLKKDIPELRSYTFNQKIRPVVFYSSGLFTDRYDDYVGDDLMKGILNGVTFELSELHVSRLFKPVFNGIFIRCHFNNSLNGYQLAVISRNRILADFQDKYCADIRISADLTSVFIAVDMKGYFFENESISMIEKLDSDLNMLKELIDFIKEVIADRGQGTRDKGQETRDRGRGTCECVSSRKDAKAQRGRGHLYQSYF